MATHAVEAPVCLTLVAVSGKAIAVKLKVNDGNVATDGSMKTAAVLTTRTWQWGQGCMCRTATGRRQPLRGVRVRRLGVVKRPEAEKRPGMGLRFEVQNEAETL
jgi:hypothetical protein